jgi:hypothetical protein
MCTILHTWLCGASRPTRVSRVLKLTKTSLRSASQLKPDALAGQCEPPSTLPAAADPCRTVTVVLWGSLPNSDHSRPRRQCKSPVRRSTAIAVAMGHGHDLQTHALIAAQSCHHETPNFVLYVGNDDRLVSYHGSA